MIEYVEKMLGTQVLLDGRAVGMIIRVKSGTDDGYRYIPKGSKQVGELFPTLQEVKQSLESE